MSPHHVVSGRLVDDWPIRWEGLSLDIFSGPYLPDRTPRELPKATLAYIYVDAVTGEWLTSAYRE